MIYQNNNRNIDTHGNVIRKQSSRKANLWRVPLSRVYIHIHLWGGILVISIQSNTRGLKANSIRMIATDNPPGIYWFSIISVSDTCCSQQDSLWINLYSSFWFVSNSKVLSADVIKIKLHISILDTDKCWLISWPCTSYENGVIL